MDPGDLGDLGDCPAAELISLDDAIFRMGAGCDLRDDKPLVAGEDLTGGLVMTPGGATGDAVAGEAPL